MGRRVTHNVVGKGYVIRLADGVCAHMTPKVLEQAGFAEYLGPIELMADPPAALKWYRGNGGHKRMIIGAEVEVVDLRVADKETLLDVAAVDYETPLDGTLDLEAIRTKVIELARAHKRKQVQDLATRDAAAQADMAKGLGDQDEIEAAAMRKAAAVEDDATQRLIAQSQSKVAKTATAVPVRPGGGIGR